jgi:hypothetical protein
MLLGFLDDAKKNAFKAQWTSCLVMPPNPLMGGKYRLSPADQARMEVKEIVELSERGLFLLKPLFFLAPDLFFHHLIPKLPCPSCVKNKGTKCYTLSSIGWNDSGLRHVFDISGSYYVICKRYKCKNCKVATASSDVHWKQVTNVVFVL